MSEIVVISKAEDLQALIYGIVKSAVSELLTQFKGEAMPGPAELVNQKELSKIIHISVSTLIRMRKAGKIPFIQIGKEVRYDKNEVLKTLKQLHA